MKVLLVLSAREVHRESNLETYRALSSRLEDLTWCIGTRFSFSQVLKQGSMYLQPVDLQGFNAYTRPAKYALDHFDIAIVDQSLDLTQDQSPSLFDGKGLANRSLDFQGADRPASVVQALTNSGTVCIGTSRKSICTQELAEAGAVLACPLEELVARLPGLMEEAQRLVLENNSTGTLKALTLRQPWAWSIFHTGKDVENRNWPAKLRGTIAIHAAAEQPDGVYERSKKQIRYVLTSQAIKGVRIPSYERLDRGAIIGLVDIVDCVSASNSPWFEGPRGFILSNPRLLPKAIPCPGKRRFFTLPSDVEQQVRMQLPVCK